MAMKIGELVRDQAGKIFRHCEGDPAELVNLMDASYSKRTFGLPWAFCADASRISAKEDRRYWADCHVVGDKRLRVCNHWFEGQRDTFCSYLMDRGITLLFPPVPRKPSIARPEPIGRNSRFKGGPIGNAQNGFIRTILSRLGE